jgi:toxin ParE1/3/4
MRVRFSNRSILQLAAIRDFIKLKSPRSAELVRLRILATIERLQLLPEMGHAERKNGSRKLRVEGLPYIIVYRVDSNDLVILGIFHGAQDR